MRALHQMHEWAKESITFRAPSGPVRMFQSFKTTSETEKGPERLKELRKQMRREKLTVFLVPYADEHQNEYLPAHAERLAWLTGFTGSAGFAVVTLKEAMVFVDGRYTLQVTEQVDRKAFTSESLIDTPPTRWIEKNTDGKDRIGYDPWLLTISQLKRFSSAAEKSGAKLVPVDNPIDRIWADQPLPPKGEVSVFPIRHAGKSAAEKIDEIQKEIKLIGADLCLLTDPASLAWLYNIRGSDMPHNPIPLGYSLVPARGKPVIFMDTEKIDSKTREHLKSVSSLAAPDKLVPRLETKSSGKRVLCDPNLVSSHLANVIAKAGGEIVEARDPVVLPRALKNRTELDGARMSHVRDGVAMARFLHWADEQDPVDHTEISFAMQLERFRRETAKKMNSELVDISFATISGSGPNGALPHYRVTEKSNRRIDKNSLYLTDSGGQYPDGTTDITRTIAIGKPPAAAIQNFTLVLKGHIAIATAVFPKGTRGIDLDPFARRALWEHGRDFAHGTGHGVGSHLNVHEGPQSISKRGMEELRPGMIISNEPGYYAKGKYGIRTENLVIVTEPVTFSGGDQPMLGFETITLAPIDLRLIDPKMLSGEEVNWLNAYHRRVFKTLAPHLGKAEKNWLKQATRKIA